MSLIVIFRNTESQTVEWSTSTCRDLQLPKCKNWPIKQNPIFWNVCPWDLFIDIANAGIIGNWLLWRLIGKLIPEYDEFILESKFSYCVRSQLKLRKSIALRCINLMHILVPLTNASFLFKFMISKTMQSTFNTNLCGGKPLIAKEFKNSTG
jgi:hypothetical protein